MIGAKNTGASRGWPPVVSDGRVAKLADSRRYRRPDGHDTASQIPARQVQASLRTAFRVARDPTIPWVLPYADIHIPSMNWYLSWSRNAQLDTTSTNTDDFDLDVITDHDTLFFVT
jgi:hypothetical protein